MTESVFGRIYAQHDAPVVRFLPKLGREISHGLFFHQMARVSPVSGCDVSFLAKSEDRGVAWWQNLGRHDHAADR